MRARRGLARLRRLVGDGHEHRPGLVGRPAVVLPVFRAAVRRLDAQGLSRRRDGLGDPDERLAGRGFLLGAGGLRRRRRRGHPITESGAEAGDEEGRSRGREQGSFSAEGNRR